MEGERGEGERGKRGREVEVERERGKAVICAIFCFGLVCFVFCFVLVLFCFVLFWFCSAKY